VEGALEAWVRVELESFLRGATINHIAKDAALVDATIEV
jgi:hypothetical protein